MAAYARNVMFRRKQRKLFENWRGISHRWFKERLDRDKHVFRQNLEHQMLNQYTDKVDALLLYMA